MKKSLLLSLSFILLLSGCSSIDAFRIETLAKTEIDMVADNHLNTTETLARELLQKLYARNPRELAKAPAGTTLNDRLQSFDINSPDGLNPKELNHKQSTEAILLALDEDFQGDRVFALIAGMTTMIRASYGNKPEFFIVDSLDEQKLYNSARNIEIMLWRLQQSKDDSGKPLILTNATGAEINLSFERLFGKLIATQDMMAKLMAQKNQRAIRATVHTLGSFVFLPI